MKSLLTSEQLIKHMKDKGISFNLISEPDAKDFLENRNYYMKLAAYREDYCKRTSGKRAGEYINLDFAYLKELSTIDRHLRYQILQLCLDIEHFLKVALLHAIEQNPDEDGYNIISLFLAKDSNSKILQKIHSNKSKYCKELIAKYYTSFPAWVFVELISFGNLISLCNFYTEQYDSVIGDQVLLNSVRDIRNACSHSNCLINKLKPNGNKAHASVVNRVKEIPAISDARCNKRLKNSRIYDYVCLLFAYDEIVNSLEAKKKSYTNIKLLFEDRMMRHADWFSDNELLTSSYRFVKDVVDSICDPVLQ